MLSGHMTNDVVLASESFRAEGTAEARGLSALEPGMTVTIVTA